MLGSKLRICTWNVRGLHGTLKLRRVMSILIKERVDIALLQETHLDDEAHLKLKHNWIGQIFFSSFTTSSRGVAILINKNIPFNVVKSDKDRFGRYVYLNGVLYGEEVSLLNVYFPPNFSPEFLISTLAKFSVYPSETLIIGGDFNCLMNPLMDKWPVRNPFHTKQSKALVAICKELDYLDVWRTLNPTQRDFTFYSAPHKCHTRIDYFLINKLFLQSVACCELGNILVSDHAAVYLDLLVQGVPQRTRRWRFNTSLLKDSAFLSFFCAELKIFLSINSTDSVSPSLVWETCKAYIRGLIISYSSSKRHRQLAKQKLLETELDNAKKEFNATSDSKILERISKIRTSLDLLLTQKANTIFFIFEAEIV